MSQLISLEIKMKY